MLEEVLRYLHNFFLVEIHEGTFAVEKGSIALPFLQNGQYFRVVGSVFNDGVYQHPKSGLTDETFDGSIWSLAIPSPVISLVSEISEWQEKNAETLSSPYVSESFGGYSYTKRSGSGDDLVPSWQDVFGARLSGWRKIKGVEP